MKTLKTIPLVAGFALLIGATSVTIVGCKSDHSDNTGYQSNSSAAVRPYPLRKCLVSDEALESGKVYTFVRNGQEIKLCCKDCLTDFDKDPAKYLSKLNTSR